MDRAARLSFLAIVVVVWAALGWFLALFVVRTDEVSVFVLLGLPALLTAGTGAIARATASEIIGASLLSSALSGLAFFLLVLWAFQSGGLG